ncbi:MAG: Cys-tRNA(Pro) deacylase [Oscillospiraceae bacterium]|nr:Cys-tRNA(Pro) deacylase [Oscillospiraceae bacterium]
MAGNKTNAMRILDRAKISYSVHEYPHGKEAVDGLNVARLLNQDPDRVFKTLVTRGASKAYYVYVVPVAHELDMKKAARAVGEKSVEMIKVSEINSVTGYIRGGCSPVGMKKQYKTVFAEQCLPCETIMVSAGCIGMQIEAAPDDLIRAVNGITADIIL